MCVCVCVCVQDVFEKEQEATAAAACLGEEASTEEAAVLHHTLISHTSHTVCHVIRHVF